MQSSLMGKAAVDTSAYTDLLQFRDPTLTTTEWTREVVLEQARDHCVNWDESEINSFFSPIPLSAIFEQTISRHISCLSDHPHFTDRGVQSPGYKMMYIKA